ncbi:carboxylesterase family protein, partial [Pseudooceanicola nanhaiensis]
MITDSIDETEGAIVATAAGRVQGVRRAGVHVFRGVPYAAPPTGARRFRPPAAPAAWEGIRPASRWPRSCPQEQREDFAPLRWYRSTLPQSEDCLYL